jgi:hypothetical protein
LPSNHEVRTEIKDVEFEVLTAAVIKYSIFWDIRLCSPMKVNLTLNRLNGVISQKIEHFRNYMISEKGY